MVLKKYDQEKSLVIDIDKNKKKIISPFCIKNKNIFYLFFAVSNDDLKTGSNTEIYLALSNNLKKWKIIQRPVIKSFSLASKRVLTPSVILVNKIFYMAFEGRDKKTSSIFIAKSKNLIKWNINEFPILHGNNKVHFHSPFIKTDKYRQIYIYYCKKMNNKSYIHLNIYKDTNFQNKILDKRIFSQSNKNESYSIYAPSVIKLKSKWIMLYAAWSKYPIKGKIMSAISHDGIKWFKKKKAVIEPSVIYDIKHCSEPAIIRFHGKFCVFYEGSDKHGRWRILKTKIEGF